MAIVNPSSGEVPEVADGLYMATIVKVTPISLDVADQFGKTEKLEISIEFDVDGEVVTLDPRVNQAWSEKATLFLIAQAAGLDPDPSGSFDTDDLLERQVNILTEQEPGKWPRVKAWSKVPKGKAAKAAQTNSAASAPAAVSVINDDGSANHTVFWKEIQKLGLNRIHVIDRVGGDIEMFTALDGPDVQILLDELRLQAVS